MSRDVDPSSFSGYTIVNPIVRKREDVGNGKAIVTLVLFFLSNVAVIFPVKIPIFHGITVTVSKLLSWTRIISPPDGDEPQKRRHIGLNYISVPLFSVLLLLAIGAINGTVIRKGIVGDEGVKPINILALFISLAYISISLDFTGLLRFSAFWVARKGGSSGRLLFLYLYVFFLVSGVIVGNDPVILSGTAFLAYFTRVTGITPPTAWIFSQFAAANMASVVLVSSNPTNLVLSGAFSISFISYTAHVVLPFLAAAVLVYPVLAFILFRSPTLVPRSISVDTPNSNSDASTTLVDKNGAIFGSILLAVTLGVLVGTSAIDVPVWQVTVPAALIMLARDFWHDWHQYRKHGEREPPEEFQMHRVSSRGHIIPSQGTTVLSESTMSTGSSVLSPVPTHSADSPTRRQTDFTTYLRSQIGKLAARFPTVVTIAQRLPVLLVPFAFLMFILVQGLSNQGWVEIFTKWWIAWVNKTGTVGAIGGMGFISCLLCNVCGTNIGATILLARVLQSWFAQDPSLDPRTRDGAIYALAFGSNYGAFTLTFSASLAGLLWRQILRQKGIRIRARQFLVLNLPIAFVAMTASLGALVGEVYVVHRGTAG
ncbi:hypothetical protein BXZ70DRAFT_736053 [Cristinia sonorae]|uniref:Citrate transporter-like domain-containing protein n=1 Tax=Cristinia sonorae TaxID=1940300 RepID=A0A8K0XSW4_9AGAR|nr:hypothetical protein BXZ70DRAFT_736053 [Cristinia sonorae]